MTRRPRARAARRPTATTTSRSSTCSRPRTRSATRAARCCRSTSCARSARSPTRPACRCTSTAPGSSTPRRPPASTPIEWTREATTMMFCVSKGLGAPIGSLLCGPAEAIREGRRLKILFGGAWRQAGIMAAAGLVALEDGPARLHEDHARARRLAEGVAEIIPGAVDLEQVETNMVYVDTAVIGLGAVEALRSAGRRSAWARRTRPARCAWSRTSTWTTRGSAWRSTRGAPSRPGRRRGPDGPVHQAVPGGDRRADPARPAAREDLAGPALRPDPVVRRHELGPRDLRRGREPLHAHVPGAPRHAGRHDRRRHALRDRVDDARQPVGGRQLQGADGAREADGRGEVGDLAGLVRLHGGPVAGGDVRRRRPRRLAQPRRRPHRGARLAAAPRRAEAVRMEEHEVADRAEALARTTSAASGRCVATTSTPSRSRRSATATRRARGPSSRRSLRCRPKNLAAPRLAASRCPRGGGPRRRASRGSAAPPSAPAPRRSHASRPRR